MMNVRTSPPANSASGDGRCGAVDRATDRECTSLADARCVPAPGSQPSSPMIIVEFGRVTHYLSSVHQEEGNCPRQPAFPGKVVPERGCGRSATKRARERR